MSNQLTAEQQRKIEENRRKALERRAQRLGQTLGNSKQTTAGFSTTPVHAQLPKQSISADHATFDPHRKTSASETTTFFPAFKKESQSFSNQNQHPNYQEPSGTGNQYNSASKGQVRLELKRILICFLGSLLNCNALCRISLKVQVSDSLHETRQHVGGSISVKSAQVKPTIPSSSLEGVAGSFYKQGTKPAQGPVAKLPSKSTTLNAVPAKKPAISVWGKCVPHSDGRFRVEVGYHAELIAVFKSIPSKNYG